MTNRTHELMQKAHEQAATENAKRQQEAARVLGARPRLTADDVVAYLDWLVTAQHVMAPTEIANHMTAAELVVRTRMGDAQNKATQHTLVDEGKIAQPNA